VPPPPPPPLIINNSKEDDANNGKMRNAINDDGKGLVQTWKQWARETIATMTFDIAKLSSSLT
jgi:hypothetical protein